VILCLIKTFTKMLKEPGLGLLYKYINLWNKRAIVETDNLSMPDFPNLNTLKIK